MSAVGYILDSALFNSSVFTAIIPKRALCPLLSKNESQMPQSLPIWIGQPDRSRNTRTVRGLIEGFEHD